MDPIRNPYAPGAGSPPPELAGRKEVRRQVQQKGVDVGRRPESDGWQSQARVPPSARMTY